MRRFAVGISWLLVGLLSYAAAPAAAKPPTSFSPTVEAQNFSITQQRQTIYDTPQYQAQLTLLSAENTANALAAEAHDSGRFFTDDLCWNGGNGCAGDIRLYNWGQDGDGLVEPVLFTARNGATLSGHVWATKAGPAERPGIVITNGSVQADEQMYWYAAQALAKDGYVVLTFDPQGQGQSDMYGETPDQNEGVPAQTDGRPFYDGTEDAVNFFLSTPQHPYEPVPSCTTGTVHSAKQNNRVKAGFDAAYDPLWKLVDPSELGLAGHSYGAVGVSYIAQWDPRVKAVVAWDDLGGPGPDAGYVPGGSSSSSQTIGEDPCPAAPQDRTIVPITKPGLGMSADYGLPPTPNTSLPNPEGKSTESLAYSKAGVDSGEVIIRGGSHLDFSWIPNQAFGASLRGPDIIDWYTSAWFDKYLKHDPTADARLLTNRWRTDPVEAGVDPNHDPNALSFYYYSRLDIHLANGKQWDCEDLRVGCPGMVSDDGYQGSYAYIDVDTSHDSDARCSIFGCTPAPGAPTALAVSDPVTHCATALEHHPCMVHAARGGVRLTELAGHVFRGHLSLLTNARDAVSDAPVIVTDGRRAATVRTGRSGSAAFNLRIGPDRPISLSYTGAASFAPAIFAAQVENLAWSTVRLASRRLPASGRAVFSGTVTGANDKPGALAVTLQDLTAGDRWRSLGTARAARNGHWRTSVRWKRSRVVRNGRAYYRVVVQGTASPALGMRLP